MRDVPCASRRDTTTWAHTGLGLGIVRHLVESAPKRTVLRAPWSGTSPKRVHRVLRGRDIGAQHMSGPIICANGGGVHCAHQVRGPGASRIVSTSPSE